MKRERYDRKPGDDPNTKRCSKCKTFKPLAAFPGIKQLGAYCRSCKVALKATLRPSTTIESRFWAKVDKRGPEECWNWTGRKDRWGYGTLYIGGEQYEDMAHRVSLRLHGTEPPAYTTNGLVCDHTCMNPACVNPAHLRIVPSRVNSLENCRSPHAKNAQKKTCKHGHPFDGWIMPKNGNPTRICLTCYPAHWRAVERFKAQFGQRPI